MAEAYYLGMKPGDLEGKPYARFWKPEMRPLPKHVRNAVIHGPEAAELGFAIEDVDQLVDPGYLPLENGTTVLPSGEIFVAVRTEMPDATGAMFEWWMGWHTQEHQRYKLWHPRAHLANGTREGHADDPNLSDQQKYRTTHFVTEYIGAQLQQITITFADPATLFSRTAEFAAHGTTAMVCGTVGLRGTPLNIGRLIHQIREVPGGSEMRSRFWLAPHLRETQPGRGLNRVLSVAAQAILTGDLARDMLVHCGMEMNHLARFLPELYRVYND